MIPVLQMRKPRLRDIEWLSQGHTSSKWPQTPNLLDPKARALNHLLHCLEGIRSELEAQCGLPKVCPSSLSGGWELEWRTEWQGGDRRQRMGQEAGASQTEGRGRGPERERCSVPQCTVSPSFHCCFLM